MAILRNGWKTHLEQWKVKARRDMIQLPSWILDKMVSVEKVGVWKIKKVVDQNGFPYVQLSLQETPNFDLSSHNVTGTAPKDTQ